MNTLELILNKENQRQTTIKRLLYLDVFCQTFLYILISFNLTLSEYANSFVLHYCILGAYQLISHLLHACLDNASIYRTTYAWHVVVHLTCMCTGLFILPLLISFGYILLILTPVTALFYYYITLKEFHAHVK